MQIRGDLSNGHIEARWREQEDIHRDRRMKRRGDVRHCGEWILNLIKPDSTSHWLPSWGRQVPQNVKSRTQQVCGTERTWNTRLRYTPAAVSASHANTHSHLRAAQLNLLQPTQMGGRDGALPRTHTLLSPSHFVLLFSSPLFFSPFSGLGPKVNTLRDKL